jgi:hypothetical protein
MTLEAGSRPDPERQLVNRVRSRYRLARGRNSRSA